jgi:N-acetylglucosamine kinase-like BadF-type ATPase
VATTDGAVLARVAGAGTRPYLDGLKVTAARLAELAQSGLTTARLPVDTRTSVASFYLANVDFADEHDAMVTALGPLVATDRLEVRNDTLAVLRAGGERGWGIAVVAGAGINAVGVRPDGREERFLGIGEMSGDWGGGYAVAVAAFGAAVRAGDGRGPQTALRDVVAAAFDRDPEDAAIAADRHEITDAQLFAFAPAVFATAAAGDAVAAEIVQRLADEVLSFVTALLVRMDLTESAVDVVLGGGTLQSGHRLLLERITAGLSDAAPKATLRVLDVPPVAGALASALTLAGAQPAAIERARSSLSNGPRT